MTATTAPLTLDQLLAAEGARPQASFPVVSTGSWSTPERVGQFRELVSQSDLTLEQLLAALEQLVGAPVLGRIRGEVATLISVAQSLAECALEAHHATGQVKDALARAAEQRERARSLAATLEGELAQAEDRERRIRPLVSDWRECAAAALDVDADPALLPEQETFRSCADRLELALDFNPEVGETP